MKETQVQRSSVITYLTNSENSGGLGYNEVINNQVRKDWFIQEDILSFLKTSNNVHSFNSVLKNVYGNDEQLFIEDYIKELKNQIIENTTSVINTKINNINNHNIAIFLRKNYNSFKFHNEKFHLFYNNNSLINNERFNENIFSIVEELTYSFSHKNPITNQTVKFRPDLTFFLNGIYLSYNELKLPTQGQSASNQGINKVSNDYKNPFNIYKNICDKKDLNKVEKENLKRELFWVFDKAIHISISDFNSMYLIRHIDKSYPILEKDKLEEYKEFMEHNISIYPSKKDQEEMFNKGYNYKNYFEMLYSKENIIKEILYYNYIEYEYKKDEKGKVNKSRLGKLFAPRNKQKYGCDITINRIKTLLENENNPDFEFKEFESKLKSTKLSEAQQKELLDEKTKLLNNKNIYSILLNYAAGFGKTDIIGLLALQIKDLTKDNKPAFNKIILVSDRIELREQGQEKLFSMNGNSNLIQEATDKKSFQKALKTARIIIVNIHKFNTISEVLSNDVKEELNKNRTIFIIDEIHRSNSNLQHQEMINLFEDLNNSFKNPNIKNIVIGLTATANEYVLQRFGEYAGCNSNGKTIYTPFDLYTMKQAIEDGFVLDFSKYVFGVPSTMYYELEETDKVKILKDKNKYNIESFKSKIYENEERIKSISKHIVRTLIKTTFPSVRRSKVGTLGKGMLAVYSKKAATLYDKWTKFYFKEELKKDKYNNLEYKNISNAKIFTIYSYSKDDDTTIKNPIELNNGLNEKNVVKEFKNNENGLIIVVDKLQTGFNEPTLHTLFLDKEIKGINAIQTCARVNRTCNGKTDCLILDYSVDLKMTSTDKENEVFSPNAEVNIPQAMEKYKDTQISNYNYIKPLKELKTIYDKINKESIKVKFYKEFKEHYIKEHSYLSKKEDIPSELSDNFLDMNDRVIKYLQNNCKKVEETYKLFVSYLSLLNKLELTIDFKELDMKKYKNVYLIKLLIVFKNLFNLYCKDKKDIIPVNVIYDEKTGLIETSLTKYQDKKEKEENNNKGKSIGSNKYSIIERIEFLNLKENNKEEKIKEWENKITLLFNNIKKLSITDKEHLVNKIESGLMEESYQSFSKILKKVKRKDKINNNVLGEHFFDQIKKLDKELWEDFITGLNNDKDK